MSKKLLFKKIQDPVYHRKLYIAIGDQAAAVKKFNEVAKNVDGNLEVEHDRLGCSYRTTEGYFLIWLPELKYTPESIDTLVHEVFHMTYAVMDYVGVELHPSSDEAFAYYAGFLTREILTAIKKHK